MRLVSYAEFVTFPAGTIYQEYKPSVFSAPMRKDDTYMNDFCLQPFCEQLDAVQQIGLDQSVEVEFEFTIRHADQNPEQLFAVWDDNDIQRLIAFLTTSLTKE